VLYSIVMSYYKMTKRIFIVLFSIALTNCNSESKNANNSFEIDSLKAENLKLKSELDSLYSLIENEKISPVILNGSYGHELKEGDSINLLVGVLYNRPNYLKLAKIELINDQGISDSISLYTGSYDFEYQYDFYKEDNINTEIELKLPYTSGEIAIIRGEITVWQHGALKTIPILYDLNL